MKVRTSKYPIGKLLIETLSASGFSIHYFSVAIGYGNSNKGVRAFDQMLKWGVPNEVFIDRLQRSSFAIPEEILNAAVEQSEEIVAEEERLRRIAQVEEARSTFRPYIQGVPEYTMPTSVTFHGLTGGARRYTHYLPEKFPEWILSEQYQYLRELIPARYNAAQGRTLFMGRLTGYRLFRRYGEQAELFSVFGEPLGTVSGAPSPEATVTLSGRSPGKEGLTGIIQPSNDPEE